MAKTKKPKHSKTLAKEKREKAMRERLRQIAIENAKDDKIQASKEHHQERMAKRGSRGYAVGKAKADAITFEIENKRDSRRARH